MSNPPITHAVYFKLKYPQGSPEAQVFRRAAMQLASIEGVEHFEWLKEVSPKNHYTHGLKMQFKDQATYDRYNTDAGHVVFVNDFWVPYVVDFIEIDTIPESH